MTATARLDATFRALADPTRRAILARLARGAATVTELAEPLPISQPAVSRHLKVLEEAELVTVLRVGRSRPRRLEPAPLAEVNAWLEHCRDVWEANYRRLDELLRELQHPHGRGKETSDG